MIVYLVFVSFASGFGFLFYICSRARGRHNTTRLKTIFVVQGAGRAEGRRAGGEGGEGAMRGGEGYLWGKHYVGQITLGQFGGQNITWTPTTMEQIGKQNITGGSVPRLPNSHCSDLLNSSFSGSWANFGHCIVHVSTLLSFQNTQISNLN
jgi:hypothetical protein